MVVICRIKKGQANPLYIRTAIFIDQLLVFDDRLRAKTKIIFRIYFSVADGHIAA
jgi:hypothetical protein